MSVAQTDTIQILQNKLAEAQKLIDKWQSIYKLQHVLIENQKRVIDQLLGLVNHYNEGNEAQHEANTKD